MMKWVARFSFTFLITGGVLFHEVYELFATPGVYFVDAVTLAPRTKVLLGVADTRAATQGTA